jgi:hypothetical protein
MLLFGQMSLPVVPEMTMVSQLRHVFERPVAYLAPLYERKKHVAASPQAWIKTLAMHATAVCRDAELPCQQQRAHCPQP